MKGLLLFFILIVIAVILHELGHYFAARKCGLIADEFNIGMGPKIWGKEYKGTQWNLRILPFGGSCTLSDDKMHELTPWQRILIFFAGPAVNLALSFVAFISIAFMTGNYNIFIDIVSWAKNVLMVVPSFFSALKTSISVNSPTLVESGRTIETVISQQTHVQDMIKYTLQLFYSLNAFLFIGNVLPIPALDGGQIFLEIPACFHHPLSEKKVAITNWVFYIAIMSVSALYLLKDIVLTIIRG